MGTPIKLLINEVVFLMAFGRDKDFHDTSPQSVYLDLDTGEILWLYEDDEGAESAGVPPQESAALRQRVATSPNRHLEIPGLDHGDHHAILREFLRSDWTDDDDARHRVSQAYFGSIGGWI